MFWTLDRSGKCEWTQWRMQDLQTGGQGRGAEVERRRRRGGGVWAEGVHSSLGKG